MTTAHDESHDKLARVFAWVGLGALLLSGVVMRYGSLSARGLLHPRNFDTAFVTHGTALLAALPLLLFTFVPWRPSRTWARPVFGGVLLFCSLVPVLVTLVAAPSDPGWSFYLPGEPRPTPSAVAMLPSVSVAFSSVAVLAIAILGARGEARVFFAIAALGQALAALGSLAGFVGFVALAFHPTLLAVFVAPFFEKRARSAFAVLAAAWLAGYLTRFFFGLSPLATLLGTGAELLAGGALGLAAIVDVGPDGWIRRAEGLFFAEAVLLRAVLALAGTDVPLHDTLFAVATVHFEGFVVVFALLRGPRTPSAFAIAAALSAQAMCGAMVVLGSRGMPARYAAYLAGYHTLQVIASLAAFALLLVIATTLIARQLRAVTSS